MASTRTYTWKAGDQLWFVSSRFLAQSGYDDVSTLVEAIRAANADVLDWTSVPTGTIVTIPYLDT